MDHHQTHIEFPGSRKPVDTASDNLSVLKNLKLTLT